ncbi:leucyl-tRNA synthetase [Emticicia oligotrophica DSM 17448]|uniref:Leucine--tRNA ligase n=1 Tax=Emticicia oligotrophica (strain DSM 17448 / CIP 109782 / MTCC 6937 / GPTSA100-15) TaxID=929562 RepID=A0ABN4ATH3_EMTOG|nr:leucine--tRNA ligase [Emticicia oligotrophica]AFK05151.1 leucyl-tRNA synthetase [Emticicia oligotrophica DSM 17448]
MSEFNHREIEKKWQQVWEENQTYKVEIDHTKPKYYVLDMFPYPSGAGLHVGHPLGYIATDIYSRYKRLKGFNVLHPMGFDSFGLPAEQYAIQTGQHPAITTENNITTYISQLKKIGFCYDWSREVRTSDAKYYKWTQWIFMELFNSWYNKESDKAEPIETLYEIFGKSGSKGAKAACNDETPNFTAEEWNNFNETEKYKISLDYRLTYLSEAVVNFCPALGMVLSNDEVKDGVSERGGYPVIQKKMQQWMMRITAYADRLITGLDLVDWSDSLKEQQRNWIGRSVGAMVKFGVENKPETQIEVFTTRVDTIYGVSFLVLAPEHELVASLTTPQQKESIDNYIAETQKRSELDRMSDVRTVSGAFTGSYCINPFNGEKVPIWIADYVLAGYGTGAVMGVPSGDQRDWNFATHFNLPIIQILDSQADIENQADATKEGKYINSGMINGLEYKEATSKLITWLEEKGMGKGKVNYRLRDAVFARQRYWGEPVPVFFKNDENGNPLPYLIDKNDLPLVLPEIDKYLPTEDGEPPLGRAEGWNYNGNPYELSTMPGWAGSSWYWFRYMDANNDQEFASKEAIDYWQNVDLYLGGTEHATGHLLYSRFWNKFLKDRGYVPQEEYAMKLINQGMIMGRSSFVYRVKDSEKVTFVSYGLKDKYDTTKLHVDVNIVENDVLDIDKFKATRNDIGDNPQFIFEDDGPSKGKYVCGSEVEKMSKSKFNVVNPDTIVERYGADTFRLYEMFLGPLTESKPWDTRGIEGTYRFVRKLWRLFFDQNGKYLVVDAEPTKDELKSLHKTIKKVNEDIEAFSFNTSVSSFMICVNELSDLKCHKKAILEQLLIILSPYAPHVTEELWNVLGNTDSITAQSFPSHEEKYLVEDSFEYPIQINGKVRATLNFPADMSKEEIEKQVLANELVIKWLDGASPKKIIVVPKRIVNVVI